LAKKLGDDYEEYITKINQLMRLLRRSICMCAVCGRPDRDMTYVPWMKSWICLNCYELDPDWYEKAPPEL